MIEMRIKDLQEQAYDVAKANGFHSAPPDVSRLLLLIHSEVSEAMEELRKPRSVPSTTYTTSEGKPEGFRYELADIVIRVADLAQSLDIDLETAIRIKMGYNWKRPHRHGGKQF